MSTEKDRMAMDLEKLFGSIKVQQEEQAERIKDEFKGWTIEMLNARIEMLDGWHIIAGATWGDAEHDPVRYGPAPYINQDDEMHGLDNVWDIEREIARRDRASK